MGRAVVAVAAMASLGMGGLTVAAVTAAPAGADTSPTGSATQTVDELVANTQATVGSVEAGVTPEVQTAQDAACLVAEIAAGETPPYAAPGGCNV